MINEGHHERLIAKLQYFADFIQQTKLEQEALSIVIDDKILRLDIQKRILIYQQIGEEYHDIFKDILYR